MERSLTSGKVVGRPVVYAGRFAGRLIGAGLPEGCRVLDEWGVMPGRLAGALERAEALLILDPLSFPFEALSEEQWDVPLLLALPPEHDAAFLKAVLGTPVLGRLGPFDHVVTRDPGVWEDLRRSYRWSEGQRIESAGDLPEEVALEVCARLEAETSGREKARYRVQAAALEPQFVEARGLRADDVPFDVLEVGGDRWESSFEPLRIRYASLDLGGLEKAPTFPHEDETFDLVFTVDFLCRRSAGEREALLSEMWRVARPGGRLMFLEEFVFPQYVRESGVDPMPVREFVPLVVRATAGRVVLEYVEALRYPGDDFFRGAVISLSKLGVPQRW